MRYRVFQLNDGRRAHVESFRIASLGEAYAVHLYIAPGFARGRKGAYGRRWRFRTKAEADARVERLVRKYAAVGTEEERLS